MFNYPDEYSSTKLPAFTRIAPSNTYNPAPKNTHYSGYGNVVSLLNFKMNFSQHLFDFFLKILARVE